MIVQNKNNYTNFYKLVVCNFNTYKFNKSLNTFNYPIFDFIKNQILYTMKSNLSLKTTSKVYFDMQTIKKINDLNYLKEYIYSNQLKTAKNIVNYKIQKLIVLFLISKIVLPFISTIAQIFYQIVIQKDNIKKEVITNPSNQNTDIDNYSNTKSNKPSVSISGGDDSDDSDDDDDKFKKIFKNYIIKFLFSLLFLAVISLAYFLYKLNIKQNFISKELLNTKNTTITLRKNLENAFQSLEKYSENFNELRKYYADLFSNFKKLTFQFYDFKEELENIQTNFKKDFYNTKKDFYNIKDELFNATNTNRKQVYNIKRDFSLNKIDFNNTKLELSMFKKAYEHFINIYEKEKFKIKDQLGAFIERYENEKNESNNIIDTIIKSINDMDAVYELTLERLIQKENNSCDKK